MKEKEEIILEILKDVFELNESLNTNQKILKVVLSSPKISNTSNCFEKVILEVFNDNVYISKYTEKQVFNENIVYSYNMLYNFLKANDYNMLNFKQINIFTVFNNSSGNIFYEKEY